MPWMEPGREPRMDAKERPLRRRRDGRFRAIRFVYPMALAGLLAAAACAASAAVDWVGVERAAATNPPLWGIRGSLHFGVHPAGFREGFGSGTGGPRGLIRVGFPLRSGEAPRLVNYLAIEPVVHNRRGYSELERSPTDGGAGLVIQPAGWLRLLRILRDTTLRFTFVSPGRVQNVRRNPSCTPSMSRD